MTTTTPSTRPVMRRVEVETVCLATGREVWTLDVPDDVVPAGFNPTDPDHQALALDWVTGDDANVVVVSVTDKLEGEQDREFAGVVLYATEPEARAASAVVHGGTKHERATRHARAALDYYLATIGAHPDSPGRDATTDLSDVLADLMHLAHADGADWDTALASAAYHYSHERPGHEDDITLSGR